MLAVGAPKELVKERGSATLEDAFISYLEEAGGAEKKRRSRNRAAQPGSRARPTAPQPQNGRQACSIARFQAI